MRAARRTETRTARLDVDRKASQSRSRRLARASSSSSSSVRRTVGNDPNLWLEEWFECANPAAISVLASMPVARPNARRIGRVDPKTKEWIAGGATLGILASQRGDAAFIEELARVLGGKEHFEIEDDDGRRAVHHAAAFGRADVLRTLAQLGCDLNAQDDTEASTPLILAACFERKECVDVLLDLGADFTVRDAGNATVGGHCAQRAPRLNEQLFRVLKAAGPGGPGRLRRGEKTYLAKRQALKNELASLSCEQLVELSRQWRANIRDISPTDKTKLVEALLRQTP
jgi:hypothetical protein